DEARGSRKVERGGARNFPAWATKLVWLDRRDLTAPAGESELARSGHKPPERAFLFSSPPSSTAPTSGPCRLGPASGCCFGPRRFGRLRGTPRIRPTPDPRAESERPDRHPRVCAG